MKEKKTALLTPEIKHTNLTSQASRKERKREKGSLQPSLPPHKQAQGQSVRVSASVWATRFPR